MKTLKTLSLLLLVVTGLMAQPIPDNMFISGYVTNGSGAAVANQVVCVEWTSNSPALPSDSLCTTTNSNGYYYLEIQNGSLTGPNVAFIVSTDDPCSFLSLTQSINNNQGTVNVATADFTVCANGGCQAVITTTVDSSLNGLVYTLTATGGFTSYLWSNNATTQSITIQNLSPNGEVYCVSVTDGSGCTATTCDTLLPINSGGCQAGFWYPGSPGTLLVGDTVQLMFDGVASNSSTYLWTLSAGGLSFSATEMNPVFVIPPTLLPVNGLAVQICVTVTDAVTNCSDTYCQTVLAVVDNSGNCDADFTWSPDSMLGSPLPAVWFTDNSTNAGSWFWDFGDNTTSTAQNPLHSYNSTGVYTVCLTIVSADQSCQNTYCETVYVGGNTGNCNANFSNSGPTPIGYTFSANVQDANLYYYWTIDNQFVGDGFDAYSPGFTNGVHTICLTLIDSLNQCSDTQCLTITVGANNCYGYISGEVFAGSNNNPLDAGVVYLIQFDPNTNQLTVVDSMVVDSGNWYFFGPLTCGDYLIKAAAYSNSQYYSNHIPTYHGNSPFWGFAQTVTLGQVNAQVTADITLIAANNPGGPGFIGGDVTEGANKTDLGDPLGGMQVMLFNLSGQAIASTYTDENGAFGFANLAYGTYQVYVEVLGVQTIPAVVTIGAENPSEENIHILASETMITTGIEEFDFDGAISDVYPNPVVGQAAININLEVEAMVNINILDLAGRTISARTAAVARGENVLRIETDQLKEGYYFLNLQEEKGVFSITRKFMRVD